MRRAGGAELSSHRLFGEGKVESGFAPKTARRLHVAPAAGPATATFTPSRHGRRRRYTLCPYRSRAALVRAA